MIRSIILTLVSLTGLIMGLAAAPPAAAQPLVSLASEQGAELLQESMTHACARLLSQYVTQQTRSFCGAASGVMVLNVLHATQQHSCQPSVPYIAEQREFFNQDTESIVTQAEVMKRGFQLEELGDAMASHHLWTRIIPANRLTLEAFREIMAASLASDVFVIVNFSRAVLHQRGSGHHSPIAAYHPQSDRLLVLDVARYEYGAFWVTTQDMWHAIHTLDERGFWRGIILANSLDKQEIFGP